MKKIFLHIGSGKTGSTAIQYALQDFQDRGLLKKHDFDLLWRDLPILINTIKEKNPKKPKFNDLLTFIEKFLYSTKKNNIIISCEALFRVLHWGDLFFSELAKIFQDYDVKILAYLRRQDYKIESSWAQGCKFLRSPEKLLIPKHSQPYKVTLDRYAQAFGKENITVRIYDRNKLYNNDSRADFLQWAGLEKLISELGDSYSNPSLSPVNLRIRLSYMRQNMLSDELKAKRHKELQTQASGLDKIPINLTHDLRMTKRGINADMNFCRTLNELLALEKTPQKNTHAYINLEKRKAYLESCKKENDAIAREYLGLKDGVLFGDELPKETISLTSPSTDDLVTSFLPIFVHLTQRIEELEDELRRRKRIINFCKNIVLKIKSFITRR